MNHLGRVASIIFLLGLVSGCSTLPRNPVPVDLMSRAGISGHSDFRARSGTHSREFEADLLRSVQQASDHARTRGAHAVAPSDSLSISGGGANGAFGAGVLHGWSHAGTRPQFRIVTGISTGALIAPFAFLGPEYDGVLKEAFTTVSAKDIYDTRWVGFLWSDAFVDSTPLAQLIRKYITRKVLQATAQAYRQGRRLYIGTTNLDADQLIVWNMGAIANSGYPEALELFRQIILASASIPGAFPPVLIDVEADGHRYDEMHVDGGVKTTFFLFASTLDLKELTQKIEQNGADQRIGKIYIIRNAKFAPEPKQVPRNLGDITGRALSSLIKSQALNDLNLIYETTQRYGVDFNWIAIPIDYKPLEVEAFDTREMNNLYSLGFQLGQQQDAWQKKPFMPEQP